MIWKKNSFHCTCNVPPPPQILDYFHFLKVFKKQKADRAVRILKFLADYQLESIL